MNALRFFVSASLTLLWCPHVTEAEILFSQDFSSHPNGPLASYYSPTPDSGQWNAITASAPATVSIVNGALQLFRPSGGASSVRAGFARTTDLAPTANVLIYRFDLRVSDNTTANSVGRFQVGTGFNTGTAPETTGVHSEIGLSFPGSGSFAIRDLAQAKNGETFGGTQSITWVINNSGTRSSYEAPNGTLQTVDDDKWDVWVGTKEVFGERPALGQVFPLTDFKFAFTSGGGTISFDNFRLENEVALPAVPEPGAAGWLAVGVVVLAVVGSRWSVGGRR